MSTDCQEFLLRRRPSPGHLCKPKIGLVARKLEFRAKEQVSWICDEIASEFPLLCSKYSTWKNLMEVAYSRYMARNSSLRDAGCPADRTKILTPAQPHLWCCRSKCSSEKDHTKMTKVKLMLDGSGPAGLERIDDLLAVTVVSTQMSPCCLLYGVAATRVHSHYTRLVGFIVFRDQRACEATRNTIETLAVHRREKCDQSGLRRAISSYSHLLDLTVRHVAVLHTEGRPVRLLIQTRKYFCKEPTCTRKIFVERLTLFVNP